MTYPSIVIYAIKRLPGGEEGACEEKNFLKNIWGLNGQS